MKNKIFEKGFTMKILNGVAIGSVVVLIPGALLNEIFKALLPIFPQGQVILTANAFAMTLMGVVVGVAVSMMFKFTPIQTASVGMATALASGAWKIGEEGSFILKGSGDINTHNRHDCCRWNWNVNSTICANDNRSSRCLNQ